MAFPKSRILSAKRLAQLIRESNECGERFCFILGSGASVESGIPSGNTLEMQWMNQIMQEEQDAGEVRKWAAKLHDDNLIEHAFKDIEAAWKNAKETNETIPSKYYFDIYKLRFYPSRRNGYRYLENVMKSSEPSLGYHVLAKLLTTAKDDKPCNLNNLVITTNFDSLVEDALFLYTEQKPLVVGHESLADYIEANIQRPIIAKVHRGLMYAPFNSPETTHELKQEWRKALGYAFDNYTPIVIGYAGGDRSLMAYLEEKNTAMRNGLYWCYRGKANPSALPEKSIQKFVEEKDGYFVTIDGFDALMVEIGITIYGDAIRPGLTAELLQKKHDKRVRQYHEQWDALNKDQGIKEVLQPMNEAERREEEQREEKEELTAWDHIRRGNRASDDGRPQEAIDEYLKAIEKDPKNAAAYNNRGSVYDDLGQYEKAIEDYNKAIELDPNYAMAYYNRGVAYKNLAQYEKSIEDYSKAIELDPNYFIAYNNRGSAYDNLGQCQKAIEDYSKAIELNPNYALAYYNRGGAHKYLTQREKAIEDYSKAIELNPNYVTAYNNRGNAYDDLGQYEKAIEDYNKAIELDPNYATAYNNRGSAYDDLGQYEKAIEDYNKAIELDPNYANAYNNRGVAHENLAQYEKAIEDYCKAIELDPNLKKAYRNRARVYRAMGEEALGEADEQAAAEPTDDT